MRHATDAGGTATRYAILTSHGNLKSGPFSISRIVVTSADDGAGTSFIDMFSPAGGISVRRTDETVTDGLPDFQRDQYIQRLLHILPAGVKPGINGKRGITLTPSLTSNADSPARVAGSSSPHPAPESVHNF